MGNVEYCASRSCVTSALWILPRYYIAKLKILYGGDFFAFKKKMAPTRNPLVNSPHS